MQRRRAAMPGRRRRRRLAAVTVAVRTVVVRASVVVRATVVVVVVERAAVAAGGAPAVAVGGVAVVQVGLGPLHQRGDPQLVQAARIAVGFTGAGPVVRAGPDGVELLGAHPGEQLAHPVPVVEPDQLHILLRLPPPGIRTVRVDPVDRPADDVGEPGRGQPARLGQHRRFDRAGLLVGQRRGPFGQDGGEIPAHPPGPQLGERHPQPGAQRDHGVDQLRRRP